MNHSSSNQEMTIKLLEEIKENHYDLKAIDLLALQIFLLEHIGDPDPHVRDDLVYHIFAHLMLDRHLTEENLSSLLYLLISEQYLTHDMTNIEKYSVLKRSFSILALVIIAYVHRRDHVLSKKALRDLIQAFLTYVKSEKIHLGYHQEIGWIHTVAHSADLFAQLIQIEWLELDELAELFEHMQTVIKNASNHLVFNEDDRMAVAVKQTVELNRLSQAFIINWVERFLEGDQPENLPDSIMYKNNVKNFLKTLYFTFCEQETYAWLTNSIQSTLFLFKNQK